MACNSSCTNCSGGFSTQCTSCGAGKYLSNGSCLACDSSCLTCTTTSTTCTSCTNILYNSKCYATCPSGFYSATVNSVLKCLACSSNCLNCSNSYTNCFTCPTTNPFLVNNTCLSACQCKIYFNFLTTFYFILVK